MQVTDSSGYVTHTCVYCEGAWVGGDSLSRLLYSEPKAPSIDKVRDSIKLKAEPTKQRLCPECNDQPLHVIHSRGVELDLCPSCTGLFFDKGELELVLPTTFKSKEHPTTAKQIVGAGLLEILLIFLLGG